MDQLFSFSVKSNKPSKKLKKKTITNKVTTSKKLKKNNKNTKAMAINNSNLINQNQEFLNHIKKSNDYKFNNKFLNNIKYKNNFKKKYWII